MNPLAIIGVVSSVVGLAQTAASLAHDVKPFVDILWNNIFAKGEEFSEEDAAAVKTKLEELRARLHLPLPPAQDDDV